MAGSKSDRKNNAKFDIFSTREGANDAVRVGYIDPKRGYVSGLSVYKANKYAERNPGTQFIISNRDKVRYLNINEVNKLTNKDTIPASNPEGLVDENGEFDPCNTVKGFKTAAEGTGSDKYPSGPEGEEPVIPDPDDPNQVSTAGATPSKTSSSNYKKYGSELDVCRTRIELQGGGGIGAIASPIVGLDGSILHVRVIHGGFGYKFPPQVRIIDDCKRGSGARAKSLTGFTAFETERFDDEADVEDYDFKLGEYDYDPDDNAWGKVYKMGSAPSAIGDWNPANVLSLTNANSFQTELNEYLAFLKGFDPNKPWWTTRDETPVRVTGDGSTKKSNKLGGVLFPVQHPAWGGEKNVSKELVDVEFEVYGQGTKGNRSITYEFTAQDGSHKFKVRGITRSEKNENRRIDLIKVKSNTTYDVVASVIKGRGARSEVVEQGLLENAGRGAKENRKFQEEQKSATIFGDIVASLNDNDDIQITARRGKFKASNRRSVEVKVSDDLKEKFKDQPHRFKRATFDLTYRVNIPGATSVTRTISPSFMNNYAVSPQVISDRPETDRAGKPYSLFYKEYFPHDGVYTFRGAADNISEVIFDGESIMDISNTFRQKPVKVKKEVKEGLHEIRIDLLNSPQKVKPKPTTKDLSITYYGLNKGITKTVSGGERKYPIQFEKLNPSNRRIEVSGKNNTNQNDTLKLRDGKGNDPNVKFTILSTSPGVSAKFSDNGRELLVKGRGDVTIRLKYDDNPKYAGEAVRSITIAGTKWRKEKKHKGEETKTIKVGAEDSKKVLGTGGFTVSRDGKSVKMRDGDGKDINSTFSIEDSTNNARFSGDGKRLITDGPGNVQLKLNWDDDPNKFGVAVEKISVGGVVLTQSGEKGNVTKTLSIQADGFTVGDGNVPIASLKSVNQFKSIGTIFNTAASIKKADRKLYRMRPDGGKSGDFFSKNGVTPFNPVELDKEIPAVPPTVPPTPFVKPKAKFIKRDGNLFLKVIGTGKAKIGFKLKTRDLYYISGVFAREVKISADGPDVRLIRDAKKVSIGRGRYTERIKEKETIKGVGEFTTGKEYKVTMIGGNSDAGFKTVDNTVLFDDDVSGGFDKNGELFIDFINAVNPPKSAPPKPPKNGRNNSSNKNLDDATGSCDDYAGIHKIVWKDVKFPGSGTYTVDVQVDDNVRLEIFNDKFKAQTLDVIGFRAPGKSNGVQSFTLEVEKGTYTIRAFLQQIPGKPIYAGNPMGLAINIKTAYSAVPREVTLVQSWNQNPFGAALTIQAPPPPIPIEPVVKPEGPCPPNPIWTTRHPAKDQWHPVSHRFANGRRSWSRFMNRYAMSPVLPIGTKGSGYSGNSWSNSWTTTIPFSGFYVFQGTVDNFAEVTITQDPESSEVTTATTKEVKKVNGFRTEKKDLARNKIFLEKGQATINVTVRNGERIKYKQVTKKIFDTKDWVARPTDKSERVNVDFDVFGQGSKKNMGLKFVFQEKGGDHSFTIDNVEKSNATKTVSKRVKRNTDYKVTAIATGTHTIKNKPAAAKERTYKIEVANQGDKGRGDTAAVKSVSDKTIKFTDSRSQDDTDAEFRIKSPSPGVTAKFRGSNDNDLELVVKGDGEVSLELYWNDDPNSNGKAVGNIKVAGETWKQTAYKDKKDSLTKTIKVGNSSNTGTSRKNITKSFGIKFNNLNPANNPIEVSGNNKNKKNDALKLRDGHGNDANAKIIIEDVKGGTAQFSDDGRSLICNGSVEVRITLEWNDNPNTAGVALDSFELGGKVWRQEGRRGTKTQTIRLDATQAVPSKPEEVRLVPEQGTSKIFGRGKKGTEGGNNPGQIIFADIVGSANDNDDMQIRCNNGIFTPSNKRQVRGTSGQGTQTRGTYDLTFRVSTGTETAVQISSIGPGFGKYDVKDKELSRSVTVGGRTPNRAPVILNPSLATYRSGKLGPFLSPFFPNGTKEGGRNLQGRVWEMVWENVEFSVKGTYKMEIEADDTLEVFIGRNLSNSFGSDGYQSIGKTKVFKGVEVFEFPITEPGKRDIKLILTNINIPGTTFRENPTVASCRITTEVQVELADERSWLINPVGISAVLLAPPCDRVVGGIGTVTQVLVEEPGNTYPITGGGIPSQVILTDLIVDKPGIGYTGGDLVCVENDDGTRQCFPPTIGKFGEIVAVPITDIPITKTPKITTITTTGVGFRPELSTIVRIDTPEVDPETVIQVTDLAGLKQTGYIEGRAYYGEVFFKDGVPFAGRYETAGRLIQVYATLQESIDAEVTTRPSAIQRSGTDVNSNNPRLNIPGTPDNLV